MPGGPPGLAGLMRDAGRGARERLGPRFRLRRPHRRAARRLIPGRPEGREPPSGCGSPGASCIRALAPPTRAAGVPEALRADTGCAPGTKGAPGAGQPSGAGVAVAVSVPGDRPGRGRSFMARAGDHTRTRAAGLCGAGPGGRSRLASERRGWASRRMRSNSLSRIYRLLLCCPDGQRMPRSHATSPDVADAWPMSAGAKVNHYCTRHGFLELGFGHAAVRRPVCPLHDGLLALLPDGRRS